MKRICLVFVFIALSACDAITVRSGEVATDNPNFKVGRLFTHNGYSVYRFYHGGEAVFYVTPASPAEANAQASTSWQTSQIVGVVGKGGHTEVHQHQVATAAKK
jgi:hypothetical protein